MCLECDDDHEASAHIQMATNTMAGSKERWSWVVGSHSQQKLVQAKGVCMQTPWLWQALLEGVWWWGGGFIA